MYFLEYSSAVLVSVGFLRRLTAIAGLLLSHDCRRRSRSPLRDATMKKKKNPHWGSSLDSFLKEEGIYDEVVAQVEKEVIAWQLQQAMKKQKITKKRMAELMKTSCSIRRTATSPSRRCTRPPRWWASGSSTSSCDPGRYAAAARRAGSIADQ